MPEFKLISHHLCPYVQRAVIVLREKEIPFERVDIDLANKPDWFSAISPLGRTPLLLVGDKAVFESQVIVEYLDEITPGALTPEDPLEKARQKSWIEYGSETLNAIAGLYSAPDAAAYEGKRAALGEKLERISREVEGPYFGGAAFQLVDGVWGTVFRYFDLFDRAPELRALLEGERLRDWRRAIAARPSVRAAAPADYVERLDRFVARRGAHLAGVFASPPEGAA